MDCPPRGLPLPRSSGSRYSARMPTGNADSPHVSVSSLERGLDELAEMVRNDGEPTTFFRALLQLLIHTVRADEAAVWLRTGEETWTRLGLSLSQRDGTPTTETLSTLPEWIAAAFSGTEMRVTRFTGETQTGQRVAGPIRQAGTVTGVLAAQFDGSALPLPEGSLIPFCGALSELTGDLLVQHELRRLRRDQQERQQGERWEKSLASVGRISQLAGVIAHDGRALCQADRLTVLQAVGGHLRVIAVSGVDVLDPRSSTLQALEALARQACDGDEPSVFPVTETPSEPGSAWQNLVSVAQTQAAVVVPVRHPRSGWLGAIIAERFTDRPSSNEEWKQKTVRLARVVTPWWATLAEAERTTWNRWFVRPQTNLTSRTISRGVWWGAVVMGVIAALVLIPAPLTIPAEGELVPAERRDVFATASGIVESVAVRHGDEVALHQPLVVLRDPALELEAARVTGELATVLSRLSTVRAARITQTSTTTDSSQRPQQLAGEEEDLQQQADSLAKQKKLLDSELASWQLNSPIAGQVLTWDVETLLSGRPVERGQVLL